VEDITKQLSVFIFPLLFSLTKMNIKKYQWQLLFLFSLVCTFTIFYLYLDAVHTIYYYRLPFFSLLSPAFENHNFSQPIDLHATYFSMYVALSFLFMLQQLIRERENRLGLFLCCIILGAGLIQLSSRAVFFAMFIILNGVFPFVFFTGKQRLKYMMVSLLCCGLVIVLIFSIGTFRERYFKDVRMDLSNTRSEETISDPRLERWKAAWKIIRQSPVTGHGSGSEITLLKDRYFSEKMYSSYLNELNAHNQYLSWLIKAGCLGLLVYLYTLFTGLQQAVAGKNALFLSFLILIIIVSVSENILDVNKGIFFYSFFFSFFSLEEPVTFRE
jgi:O-antigen ligase